MSLQNWLQIGHLIEHDASVAEVRNLLGVVDRELADASVSELSAEGRFTHAYDAALLLCKLALHASDVPKALLAEAARELIDRFEAASFETEQVDGYWRFQGKLFRDILARLTVDVPDLTANRVWMRRFKARWKKKLKQLELWVVSYSIDLD